MGEKLRFSHEEKQMLKYMIREFWEDYLDQKVRKWKAGEKCIMRSLEIFNLHEILLDYSHRGRSDGRGIQHALERLEMHIKF
jgi:hypothetical protein